MEDIVIPIIAISVLFLGLPWLIFHYVTKWKSSASLTGADEKLLDELHDMARRLDERLCTIERIMDADNPNWQQACLPEASSPIPDEIMTTTRSLSRRGEKA